jgi:hypothetical protein
MIRRIALAATTAALALGGVAVAAGPAAAAAGPTITAVGSVNCNISGKVKISPALTNANTLPSTTTAKIKGSCTGTTESGVTPTSVKSVVTSTGTTPGTCTGLLTPSTAPFTAGNTWKASGGKINPSTVVFPGFAPNGGGFALTLGTTTGSYAGFQNATAQANVDLALIAGQIATGCDPQPPKFKAAKGIKKITILSGTLNIT